MTSWGCSNYQQAVYDFNIFKISKWGLTASVIRILTFNHHPGLIRKFCSKLRHHALKLIFSGRNFKSLQGPDVILSWHDPKLDYHCQFTVRPGPLLYENNDQRKFQNSSNRMNKSRNIKEQMSFFGYQEILSFKKFWNNDSPALNYILNAIFIEKLFQTFRVMLLWLSLFFGLARSQIEAKDWNIDFLSFKLLFGLKIISKNK